MAERAGGTKRGADENENERDLSPPPLKRRVPSTTSANKMASFFTPTSQKPPEKTHWRAVNESLLIAKYTPANTAEQPAGRRRIASFDLDGTIISTLSGKLWSKDASDWKWWHICIPGQLKRLHQEGYQIIFFTNQGSINLKTNSKAPKPDRSRTVIYKTKVTAILDKLDLPITVYAATAYDTNRKPRAGMWTEMLEDYDLNEGDGPDMKASFFVGDAAGRKKHNAGLAKDDFANTDRDFAANVGIPFFTPEEFFLKQAVKPFERSFDPSLYLDSVTTPSEFLKRNEIDIVLLCGSPGVGKSTFYWTHLQPLGYERVNQDIFKSREKCLKKASEMLDNHQPVAVDNTNADFVTREYWVQLATQHKVPIRCVQLEGTAKLCEHNNAVRALAGAVMNPEARSMLPQLAFSSFKSRFQAPSVEEGFQDVTVVPFRFAGTAEQKSLWKRYWI